MSDITYCQNRTCLRDCQRKLKSSHIGKVVSIKDFGKDYKGEQIDYDKCKYYLGGKGGIA